MAGLRFVKVIVEKTCRKVESAGKQNEVSRSVHKEPRLKEFVLGRVGCQAKLSFLCWMLASLMTE